ncbi:MAG: Thrombospondin type 3 repeat [Frankiales bacterium]|nr:Thrombospondin type 3 repeat [Frankiales bacterium]
MRRIPVKPLRNVLLIALVVALAAAVPALGKATPPKLAATGYVGTHFGSGNIPAGCILDKDEDNPDNKCTHMRVGLNALDSPIVNVAVLVPVSPMAERDMRIMRQAVEMWDGGIHMLAKQMNLDWLDKGVKFNITTKLVPVDANGLPTQAINLVKPKIVVIATNPVGGIGIGIDPTATVAELGIVGSNGNPCVSVPNPFSMMAWQARPWFDDHHGDLGGYGVQQCDGPGGQVCFSVNGAVDPVPGVTDFFSIYDLVAHETGHCLTLGHVGDGADGPWGPTPTNDIMAYSSDPVDRAKCVSSLDVTGFALRMSNFLDVNGDKKVDDRDVLQPNDKAGDGTSAFQLQNPSEEWYASKTGDPEDCPQPDFGTLPLAEETNWRPALVPTTVAKLKVTTAKLAGGRVTWSGVADRLAKDSGPLVQAVNLTDATGDGTLPMTDITGLKATLTPTTVNATLKVDTLWPTTDGGRATGYGLYVGGRKFDSFVLTQGTSSDVQTIDSGGRFIMPAGTSTWDTAAGTVTFKIPRSYLADKGILAPYKVFGETGVHIRTKDWVMSLDRVPNKGAVRLTGPAMVDLKPDVPLDTTVHTTKVTLQHEGGNTFTPADTSTDGVPLVPVVGNVHSLAVPLTKQAAVKVTLTWDDPGSALGLQVKGGSGQVASGDATSVSVTVPWAHRALVARVIPTQITSPSVTYKVVAEITTLVGDKDGDSVPDVADLCPTDAGPREGAGCPDTDQDGMFDKLDACPTVAGLGVDGCPALATDKVVALLDGKQIGVSYLAAHGARAFSGSAPATAGAHQLELVWSAGSRTQAKTTTLLGLPVKLPTVPTVPTAHPPLAATGAPAGLAAFGLLVLAGAVALSRSRRRLTD